MALTTNTVTHANGVTNTAIGKVVTDAGAAAATTFTVGFVPRVVRFHNLTDRISDEWLEGMAAASSLHTIATGVRTLETTNGITVNSTGTFTVTAVTMVASKTFYWEAIG
jgi:phosphatidylserine synthase